MHLLIPFACILLEDFAGSGSSVSFSGLFFVLVENLLNCKLFSSLCVTHLASMGFHDLCQKVPVYHFVVALCLCLWM